MRAVLATTLLLTSCATPSPLRVTSAGSEAPVPVSPTPALLIDPLSVDLSAVRAPKRLVVDGELDEWELPEPIASRASRVAFALTGAAAFVAADLGEAAQGGVWLGVGSVPPEVPEPGEYRHASGAPLNCDTDDRGEPLSASVAAACKHILVRHAELVAEHDRAFTQLLLLARDGVRSVRSDGSLATVKGAKLAWKSNGKRASVEVSLPLTTLPRVAEAPLATLRLVARPAADSRPPVIAPGAWESITLPEPVSFEPHGELRARLFDALQRNIENLASVSYRPGDPHHIETFGFAGFYDRRHVVAQAEKIFDEQASVGAVSVGYTTVAWRNWITVLKAGKLMEMQRQPGVRKGILVRDGEVHAFSYDDDYDFGGSMRRYAQWHVIAIAPDGSSRPLVEPGGGKLEVWDWREVTPFAAKQLDTFGIRGWGYDALATEQTGTQRPEGLEVTYRWDKAKRLYVRKERRIPVPSRAKRK